MAGRICAYCSTTKNSHRRLFPSRKKRSEEHTSELQSRLHLVCRLLLEKKKNAAITACSWDRARPTLSLTISYTDCCTNSPSRGREGMRRLQVIYSWSPSTLLVAVPTHA